MNIRRSGPKVEREVFEEISRWDWSGDGFACWPIYAEKWPGKEPEVMWHDGEYNNSHPPERVREFCRLLLLACDRVDGLRRGGG